MIWKSCFALMPRIRNSMVRSLSACLHRHLQLQSRTVRLTLPGSLRDLLPHQRSIYLLAVLPRGAPIQKARIHSPRVTTRRGACRVILHSRVPVHLWLDRQTRRSLDCTNHWSSFVSTWAVFAFPKHPCVSPNLLSAICGLCPCRE